MNLRLSPPGDVGCDFIRGPKIFLTTFFVQNWKSWVLRQESQQLSNPTPKVQKSQKFHEFLIKAILLQQVISSFHMSSFKQGQRRHGVPMTGLSIDSKLPIVAYATAFDHFAMCCQLLLLSIILGILVLHLKTAKNYRRMNGKLEVEFFFCVDKQENTPTNSEVRTGELV